MVATLRFVYSLMIASSLLALAGCARGDNDSTTEGATRSLAELARRGDVEGVRLAIANGADLERCDELGLTPIHYASLAGHPEIVGLLLDGGCPPDLQDQAVSGTPLHHAAGTIKPTRAYAGPFEGRRAVIERLLEEDVSIDSRIPQGPTALCWAVRNADYEMASWLIDNGARPDQAIEGRTLLHVLSSSIGTVRGNEQQLTGLLVQNGVAIDALDSDGQTALYRAVAEGLPVMALALLEHGASPNLTDKNGNAPIHKAVEYGNIEVVKALLENEADLTLRGHLWKTPLELARDRGHTELVELLERAADE
ncbi:MAG: ankyrin repeat domain-containing protein [Phycisphaerales bacterium]|nr:MAG: ankyrin repeat domain-containing protein [Phycisphaerales bacterium]